MKTTSTWSDNSLKIHMATTPNNTWNKLLALKWFINTLSLKKHNLPSTNWLHSWTSLKTAKFSINSNKNVSLRSAEETKKKLLSRYSCFCTNKIFKLFINLSNLYSLSWQIIFFLSATTKIQSWFVTPLNFYLESSKVSAKILKLDLSLLSGKLFVAHLIKIFCSAGCMSERKMEEFSWTIAWMKN